MFCYEGNYVHKRFMPCGQNMLTYRGVLLIDGSKIPSIGANDALIPRETFLGNAPQVHEVMFAPVHIDQPVPLAESLMGTEKVDYRPRAVAQHLHSVLDGLTDCFNMMAHIRNTICIVDFPVFRYCY